MRQHTDFAVTTDKLLGNHFRPNRSVGLETFLFQGSTYRMCVIPVLSNGKICNDRLIILWTSYSMSNLDIKPYLRWPRYWLLIKQPRITISSAQSSLDSSSYSHFLCSAAKPKMCLWNTRKQNLSLTSATRSGGQELNPQNRKEKSYLHVIRIFKILQCFHCINHKLLAK